MEVFIRVLKDIALMLTCIIMGIIMIAHGWHRWQNEGITAEVNILGHAGIPNPGFIVWLLIGFEVIGSIFLVFGLAIPVIGLGLVVLNIGIIFTLKSHTFYVYNFGWEYNTVTIIVDLILMTHGTGRIGLGNLFRAPKDIQPQTEEQPKHPARSLPEGPAHSLPDEWDDTPVRGIQPPQEIHNKFMAKPYSELL